MTTTDGEIKIGSITLPNVTSAREGWTKAMLLDVDAPVVGAGAASKLVVDPKFIRKTLTITGFITDSDTAGQTATQVKNSLLALMETNNNAALTTEWRGFTGGSNTNTWVINADVEDLFYGNLSTQTLTDVAQYTYTVKLLIATAAT